MLLRFFLSLDDLYGHSWQHHQDKTNLSNSGNPEVITPTLSNGMTAPVIGDNSTSASPSDSDQEVQTGVIRRNLRGTKATDYSHWPEEAFENMDSTLAVQQFIQQVIVQACSFLLVYLCITTRTQTDERIRSSMYF